MATYFVQAALTVNALTPVVPTKGAYETGVYRNLFKELGKTDAEIKTKLDTAWNSLFKGDNNSTIYFEVGSDEAFIEDINNGDCRSEGQSYGMMICVQMDKQTEFNKLWKFARNHMYQSSGQFKGFFGWQCNVTPPYSLKDTTPASDGEEYFATSLLFAARRWGNGTGIYNYEAEAQALLDAMLHQADDGQGYNMFNNNSNQVVFCPSAGNYDFTDPSYHLPGFYELWALWGPTRDRAKWQTIAATSRSFFQKTTHPSTGLGPDYANFDGSPKSVSWGGNHQDFMYDAQRIANNIAFDYAWWAKDSWAKTHADRIQDFFVKQGLTTYTNTYTLSGSPTGNEHQMALVAMNAVASLAATKDQAYDFVNELWKLNPPTGKYRYYDGCLLFFALLHCSGNFKIWGAPNVVDPTPTQSPTSTNSPTTTKVPLVQGDLNNDEVVNMADVILLATKFNSVIGDGKYVAAYDINNDGVINMADVIIIATNFGKTAPVVINTSTNTPTNTPTTTPTNTPTPVPSPKVTIKIMPLGDSITDGFNVPGGYRIKLWKNITSNGQLVDFVGSMNNGPSDLGDKNHEGHSGWTISQIDTNINTWMDSYKPQIVLLHIGTNDMYNTTSGPPERLSTLIDKICAKLPTGGKLYVSNIIPFPRQSSFVSAYNSKIPGIVQQKASAGKPVYFVDMFSAISDSDLADGIHPNATGYNKMADVWYNAIKNDLN